MSVWRFEPQVDGQPVVDGSGQPVAVEVEVAEEPAKVDVVLTVDGEEIKSNYLLPDKVYNVLKWVALLLLPTLAWMSTSLGDVWGFDGAAVSTTLNICGTAIAALIGVSTLRNEA